MPSLPLWLFRNCKCSQTSLFIYSQTGSILFLAHIYFCLSSNCEHAIPTTCNVLSISFYTDFIHCPLVASQEVFLIRWRLNMWLWLSLVYIFISSSRVDCNLHEASVPFLLNDLFLKKHWFLSHSTVSSNLSNHKNHT